MSYEDESITHMFVYLIFCMMSMCLCFFCFSYAFKLCCFFSYNFSYFGCFIYYIVYELRKCEQFNLILHKYNY